MFKLSRYVAYMFRQSFQGPSRFLSNHLSSSRLKLTYFSLALLWLLTSPALFAQKESTKPLTIESQQLLTDLQQKMISTVLAIGEFEKDAGNSVEDLHIIVDLPAKQSSNLGLVLDLNSDPRGYRILSVTPGSFADKLKLGPGNLIIAVNKVPVENSDKRKAFSEFENSLPGDSLRLTLDTNGKIETVESILVGQYTPAIKLEIGGELTQSTESPTIEKNETACGRVSVFFTPPSTKHFYNAKISKIDDRNVSRVKETFRLKPGKHVIHLHELIDDPLFTRRFKGSQKAKPLQIDIKPNTTYYLAARFIKGKAFRQRKGEYWEPVVWKETVKGQCEL